MSGVAARWEKTEGRRGSRSHVLEGAASAATSFTTYTVSRKPGAVHGPSYAERTIDRPRVLVILTPTRWMS